MPDGSIDPGSLEGDALTRWYLRSPSEIEQERQAAAARRNQDFFYGPYGSDPEPGFSAGAPRLGWDVDPDIAVPLSSNSQEVDPGFTWIPAGPNRWRSVKIANDVQTPRLTSYSGTPSDGRGPPAFAQDQVAPGVSGYEADLAAQPITPSIGDLRGPPAATFGVPQLAANPSGPLARGSALAYSPAALARASVSHAGPHPVASGPSAGQTIAYGALRAAAPSDQELAELRRQQAAFSDTTRKIDLQNSWFAAPALAAPLAVMGLEGAAAWAARSALPEAEQAALQFIERDPYLRVGDNWATRAGRRAHAALKERLAQKPGWEYEPKLPREGQRPLKPDMGTPQRNPVDPTKRKYIELKPDSPSGRAAGARALERYRGVTKDPVRLLFYNLKDFI